ncbi:UNVERIFIED_CONTAM: hypothetical protein FKN15_068205 [Acipenser sinensis]
MAGRGSCVRGSRGPSFAQILKKNTSVPPGMHMPFLAPNFSVNLNNNSADVGSKKDVLPKSTKGAQNAPAKEETRQKNIPEELLEKYRRGETHAVSALYELAQLLQFHLEFKETVTTGNIQGLYFAFCAVIDGVEYKTGMGQNKKEAKASAARSALDEFLQSLDKKPKLLEASAGPPPLPLKPKGSLCHEPLHAKFSYERKNPMYEKIPLAVKQMLNKLIDKHPEFRSCGGTVAAFVIETPTECEVVAIGTGDFNTSESVPANGRTLHDSHAVVSARRSLLRKNPTMVEKSIFVPDQTTKLLILKTNITIHLYMNQLPKGAAQIQPQLPHINLVSSAHPIEMSLAQKTLSMNWSQGDISLEIIDGLTGKTVESSPFKTGTAMASRLCKAAMLSRFNLVAKEANRQELLEAVTYHEAKMMAKPYQEAKNVLRSYVMQHGFGTWIVKSPVSEHFRDANCSDVRGIEIAVKQRVDGITSRLPMYYCVYRPHINLVSSAHPIEMSLAQKTLSMNWSQGDISLEIIDGLTGKTVESSPFKTGTAMASRLCKAAMLSRFNLVAKEANRQELLEAVTYHEAKMMAKPYQEAKNVLRSYVMQHGFGTWIVKSPVSEHFSM